MAKLTETAIRRLAGLDPFPLPSVIAVRHPVVFMHGFGMLAGLRRGGHLSDAATYLRTRGVRAYAPNVAPYNTVDARCHMWLQRLRHVLEESRGEKLNLIAHSMGGLDARYLITKCGFHDRVASLVTISTPHHGSVLAEYVLGQPDRIRTLLTDIANWMGTKALEDAEADFSTAVSELTPDNVRRTFNTQVPNHADVRYWSYAASAGRGCKNSINPFLRLGNGVIYETEGLNDGMVSTESAQWGQHLGTINADHAQQIGFSFPGAAYFDHKQFYASVAEMLANESL